MPFTNVWDTTTPPDTQAANLLGQDIRNLKVDTMQRMAAISGPFASRPVPETVNANWTGLLYFSTDTNQIFQWNGAAWILITIGAQVFKTTTLGTNATAVLGSTINQISIPANTLQVGSIVDLATAWNAIGGVVTANLLFGAALGGNLVGVTFNNGHTVYVRVRLTIVSIGVAGSGIQQVETIDTSGSVQIQSVVAIPGPFNTTVPLLLASALSSGGTLVAGPTSALVYI